MRRSGPLALAAIVLFGDPGVARAQRGPGETWPLSSLFGATSLSPAGALIPAPSTPGRPALAPPGWPRATSPRGSDSRDAWWAPVASAVIPGSGQVVLGQSRAIPYFAIEGFAWVEYIRTLNDGRGRRREYQRLARVVARAAFGGRFPTGDFEYYETMEKFTESGEFDLNPGGVLEPEIDTTTFNGSMWLLARRTYWEDPDAAPPRSSAAYQRAEAFYRQRAVGPDFRWSWRNAQLEQDVFRRTIERSNSAFRLAAAYLGVLIANHALSAVDAFVALRLRHTTESARGLGAPGESRLAIEGRVRWAPFGYTHRDARRP